MIGKNNLLNIRSSTHYSWQGQTGSVRGFCSFDSEESCRRAGAYLLMRSYRRAGCNTITKIIERWAPASENPTQEYIMFVSKMVGIAANVDMVFDNDYACALAAMEIFENGIIGKQREMRFDYARNKYLEVIQKFNIRKY